MLLQYKGPLMLDWPLIGIMSLTADGSTPHLVLQAKREMPSAADQHINWFGEYHNSSEPSKRQPGSSWQAIPMQWKTAAGAVSRFAPQ